MRPARCQCLLVSCSFGLCVSTSIPWLCTHLSLSVAPLAMLHGLGASPAAVHTRQSCGDSPPGMDGRARTSVRGHPSLDLG